MGIGIKSKREPGNLVGFPKESLAEKALAGAWEPKLLSLRALEPVLHKRSHRNEKPVCCNYRIIPAHSN